MEIERADSGTGAHDLRLLVRVRYHGFAAEIDTWVLREAWLGFTQDLCILEERRHGQAKLESISPGELSIVIRSTDRAGHMGVEGLVGARGYDYQASLRFGVLAFDPSQLPALAHAARKVAELAPM